MGKAKMPTSIKVGCHTYTVLRKPKAQMPLLDGSRLYARCDPDGLQIHVQKGLRRSRVKEYLLHEVKHACNHLAGTYGKVLEEEEFVDKLAQHLLQVLQDNPDFVAFLIEKDE